MKLQIPFVPEPIRIRVAESDEEILAKKEQFAELMLRENDAFKVACVIYPDDTGKALQAASQWPKDPVVVQLQESLLTSEDELSFLPTKAELARELWQLAKRDDLQPEQRDSKVKALRTYGDVRGFVEKPAVSVQQNIQNNTIQNNVMVVPDHGTDSDWEAKMVAQQKRLKSDVIEYADNT